VSAVARLGLERPARYVYVRRTRLSRRNNRDNEHLNLLLAFSLAADSNCIDIGAHSGDVLRDISRLAPQGRHMAFEPLPAFASDLQREFPEVDVRQAALSNEVGTATFSHVREQPALSGLHRRSHSPAETETISVRTETLDSVLPDGYVPRFIKLDVEGAEGLVLEGALETLRRHRPIVWFEHGKGGSDYYGWESGDVHSLLVDGAGLRVFDADGHGPYSRTEFEGVFEKPIWNFVAHA
jgi:FkbM family methyltransferase